MASSSQSSPNLTTSPWFEGAPISKTLCMTWWLGYLFFSNKLIDGNGSSSNTVLSSMNRLFWYYNTNGTNTNNDHNGSMGSVIIGTLLLGQWLRKLERSISSRKLLVFIGFQYISLFALLLLIAGMEGGEGSNHNSNDNYSSWTSFWRVPTTSSGPYPLVGGALYWYWKFVPRLHPRFISISGISMSEKVFWYAWGAYVLFGPSAMNMWFFTLWGYMMSALYFFPPIHSILPSDLPSFLVNILPWESLGNLLFLDPPPKIYAPVYQNQQAQQAQNNNAFGGMMMGGLGAGGVGVGGMRNGAVPRRAPPPAAARAPVPPSQEAIDQLTAMGFEESQVRAALQQTNNNVERAADRLLSG